MRRLVTFAAATALTLLVVISGKSAVRPADAAAVVRTGDTITVTGPKIALTHGIVQVRLTITGGRITDIRSLQAALDAAGHQ